MKKNQAKGMGAARRAMGAVLAMGAMLLTACYSNNCPLENTVTCNYGLYDAEGNAISYGDTVTISTLMPGYKTVYTYRRLGNRTVTKDERDSALLELGYTETTSLQRNDTVLLNKVVGASSFKIPMSYYNEYDTLVLSYASISLKDTIWLQHRNYAYVELPECGAHRFHTLMGIRATDAAIDHVEISEPQVSYAGSTNVKIYFNGVLE